MQSTEEPEGHPSGASEQEPPVPVTLASPPQYASAKEAAELIGCSRLSVYRRFHAGVFHGRRIGRKIDIYRPVIDALAAEIRSGRPVDIDKFAAEFNAGWAVAS